MSGLLRSLCSCVCIKGERKAVIVIIGLDNAGKTTLLNTLRGQPDQETTPSYGFSSHTVQEGDHTVQLYDLGGGRNIRRIWKVYLAEVHGAIFVVDAADKARFPEACAVVQDTLSHPQLQGKPLLVLANKQDLPNAAPAHEVASALGLAGDKRPSAFSILPCIAKPGQGQAPDPRLRQGLGWLCQKVECVWQELNPRVAREAEAARAEELKAKKAREAKAKASKEERERGEREAAAGQKLAAAGKRATKDEAAAASGLIKTTVAPEQPPHNMLLPGATAGAKGEFSDLKATADLLATPRLEGSQGEAAHHQSAADSATAATGLARQDSTSSSTAGASGKGGCVSGRGTPAEQQQQQQQQQAGEASQLGRRTSKSLVSGVMAGSSNRVQPLDPAAGSEG